MKFILCSVFLAHGAVVYTACTPVFFGLCQAPTQNYMNNLTVCVVPVLPGKCRPAPRASSRAKKIHPIPFRIQPAQRRNSSSHCIPTKTQDGWQMVGDFHVNTPHDITIHFSIDTRGRITHITVSPFTAAIYQELCNQLKHIHFTWHGPSSPPTQTMFEKKICIR